MAPEISVQCATLDVGATKMQEPSSLSQHLHCQWRQIQSIDCNLHVCDMLADALQHTWLPAEMMQVPATSSQVVEVQWALLGSTAACPMKSQGGIAEGHLVYDAARYL